MVSSTPAGSGLPIGLMPGALPSDHCSRQTLNTTAMRLLFGQSQSAFFMDGTPYDRSGLARHTTAAGAARHPFAGLQRQHLQDFVLDRLPAGALRRLVHPRLVGDPRRAVEHHDAVADVHRLVDVMGDEHRGLAGSASPAGRTRREGRAPSSRRATRTARRTAECPARPRRPARSRRAGACRRTARADSRSRDRTGRAAPASAAPPRRLRCAWRRGFPVPARRCRARCATASAGRSGTRCRSCRGRS